MLLDGNDNHRYLGGLDDLGYFPIPSKADHILYEAAKKSMEWLGESASTVLLDHICSINGLSQKELFTNYDLFEKSLYTVLKKGADVIVNYLKKELLIQAVLIDPNITVADICDPRLTVDDILNRIRTVETLEFVRNIPSRKHIALLYTNKNSKDKMFAAFFDTEIDSNTSKGIFSIKKPAKLPSYVNNIMFYEELLHEPREYEVVARRVADWIAKMNSSNNRDQNNTDSPSRIAGEDAMWCVRNGFASHILGIEKSMGRYLQDNMSVLCGYNISNVSNGDIDREYINTLVATHGHVILDDPFTVYEFGNPEDKM
jgi:hypothetical protein